MLNFKTFLNEAKISEKNLDRVATIFRNQIQKAIGTKLYRYGGPTGFSKIKKGKGITYFYQGTNAIRINYIGGEVHSISTWQKFTPNSKADRTIKLNGVNLVQNLKEIVSLVKNPSDFKDRVVYDLGEGKTNEYYDQELSEANKRVKPVEFLQMVVKSGEARDLSKVRWDIIQSVAVMNSVNIPAVVRKLGLKKKKSDPHKLFDLTSLSTTEPSKEEPIKPTKITVSTSDNISVPASKTPNKADTVFDKVMNMDPKEESKFVDTQFFKLKQLSRMVIRGVRNSLIVYGGPGIGKTFTVLETLKEEGLGGEYTTIKGKITTAALYQTLFLNKSKNDVILMDDTDSVWKDQDAANILKAALDTYPVRTVSWISARTINVTKFGSDQKKEMIDNVEDKLLTADDPSKIKLPSEFEFEGRIIFISNLGYSDFDSAVMTRSLQINMDLTASQIFTRMKGILKFMGPKNMSMDKKLEVFELIQKDFEAKQMKIKDILPSMRMLDSALDIAASGIDGWELLLDHI